MNSQLAIEYMPIGMPKPHPLNSRTHDEDQVVALADLIRRFGFNKPILIDESDFILAGHGALAGAKLAGLKEVPCVRVTHLSDEEKRAYLIADNRSAELSVWDEAILLQELEALSIAGFDEVLLGFTQDDIDAIAGDYTGSPEEAVLDDHAAASHSESLQDRAGGEAIDLAQPREKSIYPVVIYFSRKQWDAWTARLKQTGVDGAALIDQALDLSQLIDPDKEEKVRVINQKNGVA